MVYNRSCEVFSLEIFQNSKRDNRSTLRGEDTAPTLSLCARRGIFLSENRKQVVYCSCASLFHDGSRLGAYLSFLGAPDAQQKNASGNFFCPRFPLFHIPRLTVSTFIPLFVGNSKYFRFITDSNGKRCTICFAGVSSPPLNRGLRLEAHNGTHGTNVAEPKRIAVTGQS